MLLLKINELIKAVRRFNLILNDLSKKQKSTEQSIKKISARANQLEVTITKIFTPFNLLEIRSGLSKSDQIRFEENSLTDQLELDIKAKSKKSTNANIEGNFLNWDILLQALHFPNDKNDSVGFEALKIARMNNAVLELLRVSEDFLNLLAQDGIYLDDLIIEAPPVEAWLNFVNTDKKFRTRKLSCVGIDEYIEKLKLRAKADAVFRDTALMLFRRFDRLLRDKIGLAQDHQIFRLASTRSGKAFLIVGKISDIF